jgi:hypothetical protein
VVKTAIVFQKLRDEPDSNIYEKDIVGLNHDPNTPTTLEFWLDQEMYDYEDDHDPDRVNSEDLVNYEELTNKAERRANFRGEPIVGSARVR